MSSEVSNINYNFKFEDIQLKATQGFLATATVRILSGASNQAVLVGAALSALSTLVDSVAFPVIKKTFSKNPIMLLGSALAYALAINSFRKNIEKNLIGEVFKTTAHSLSTLCCFLILNWNKGDKPLAYCV